MLSVSLWLNLQENKLKLDNEKTLLEELATIENLSKSWNLLRKENEDSCGLSGFTIEDFKHDIESNILKLSEDIKNKRFHFSPTKAAVIKKDNGNFRPLQIPEIGDRVVLKAISMLLETNLANLLQESADVSFAYQKGKGVREAVLKLKSSYQKGNIILKADIINFFEEIQRQKLLEELVFPYLKDDSINKLIKEALTQRVGFNKIRKEQRKLFINAGSGIPQGNPLSPLLSNVYLTKFDLFVKELGYSMIRYADDFIVIVKSEDEAKNLYRLINNYLKENYSLSIHPIEENAGKTIIINPGEKEMTFLSIKFDGKNIYPSKESVSILKSKIKKIIDEGELNSILFSNIYQEVEKWISIYSYLDIERYFNNIDSYLICQLRKKFGKRNYIITKCKNMTNKVRNKQYAKSTNSFWRNLDLLSYLPRFIRKRKIFSNR